MKAVLVVKNKEGDFILIPQDVSEAFTLSIGEVVNVKSLKGYEMGSEIRSMLDPKEPEKEEEAT